MKKPYSIELFYVDGKPDGMITAQIPFQWTGHILSAKRNQLTEALSRDEAHKPGVYLLMGEKDGTPFLYIGETENIAERFKDHDVKKNWWDAAIFITNTTDQLNKAHVKYLEHKLHYLAKKVGRVALDNRRKSNAPTLSEVEVSNMDVFFENILLVLPALRIDYFISNIREIDKKLVSNTDVEFELNYPKENIVANALFKNNEMIVLKGSGASKKITKSLTSYKGLRTELINTNILIDDGVTYIFDKDYAFKSTSAAATIIYGRAARGPTEWKVAGTQRTYADWEAEQLQK